MSKVQSFRSKVVTRRTYNRPLDEAGTIFETWQMTVDRCIQHQKWLWTRQIGRELNQKELDELQELRGYMLDRKASLSGRTLWLGGTDTAKTYEASMFNCSGLVTETVYDVVDSIWLLMQGCGVGFKANPGQLTGFRKYHNITVVRSTRTDKGNPNNVEFIRDRVWTIRVGDSAIAWSKAIGKMIIGKNDVDEIVLDFSEVRPAGTRLKGYGWISSGDRQVSLAFKKIAEILNHRADQLLTKIDILDIENWLGTILSSRRSAEIALQDYGQSEWEDFVAAKTDYWKCQSCGSHNTTNMICQDCGDNNTNDQRTQSNNSILFQTKPTRDQLVDIFERMEKAGGSEPGFVNAVAARKRAPWFQTVNPCCEILLPNKGFCNLVEINVAAFGPCDIRSLMDCIYIMARANYRQTCVNLNDGILQESWHANNSFLRLCGVGLTGVAQRPDLDAKLLCYMRGIAKSGANSMADQLGTPRPKNVTTIKPSGTLSKVMDSSEGVHTPLGKYIFNNIGFSEHDPLVPLLQSAGYRSFPKPADPTTVIITLPVEYEGCKFTEVNGTPVNLETAIDQLERYKLFQVNWTDQNTSVTISYDLSEVPAIIDWLMENWDDYVGVSFIYRNDPTKTAKDLGYTYLPQEVVSKEEYEKYVSQLKEVDLDSANTFEELDEEGCVSGVCPIK